MQPHLVSGPQFQSWLIEIIAKRSISRRKCAYCAAETRENGSASAYREQHSSRTENFFEERLVRVRANVVAAVSCDCRMAHSKLRFACSGCSPPLHYEGQSVWRSAQEGASASMNERRRRQSLELINESSQLTDVQRQCPCLRAP